VDRIIYTPIGVIHSPFKKPEDAPIQPTGAEGVSGVVELLPEYAPGLKDLSGFSHLYLIYHFHLSRGFDVMVTPFLDRVERGLFATRAPRRPNAIGLSVVSLAFEKGNILRVENIDVLDNTPLLDIKPHVPRFDSVKEPRTGWMEGKARRAETLRSDGRFK